MVMIVIDCIPDPSNHNLFPFEFVMIAILTLPAYVGGESGRRGAVVMGRAGSELVRR